MTNEMLESIYTLTMSPDNNNRELGIVLAVQNGFRLDDIIDKIFVKNKFYNDFSSSRSSFTSNPSYILGDYTCCLFSNEEFEHDLIKNTGVIFSDKNRKTVCKGFIWGFIKENYPDLLSKL